MKWALLACRVGLAAVFLYAGVAKASSSAEFLLALAPFTFVPVTWLGPIARLLPLAEILGAILILPRRTRRAGAAVLLALLLVFIGVIGWALANGIIVACSCFGVDETPSAWKMALALGRDVVLAAMAAFVLAVKGRH